MCPNCTDYITQEKKCQQLFHTFLKKSTIFHPLEHNFTEVLNTIALVPKTLYFRGKLPENMVKNGNNDTTAVPAWPGVMDTDDASAAASIRPKSVAIVGSRHNTKYGEDVAYHLAYELAKKGVVIVSGLAYGIDTVAHRACLDAGGITVAVLGTPIDRIYPREHLTVAQRIVEQGGAIISEYAPGANILPKISFLERNRLISGLADIVVIVEAADRSGTLNTAAHALDQGKEVFAVPGNITSPYSQGCNKLISQGATPYTEPDDILRVLFPEDYTKKQRHLRAKGLVGDSSQETKVLQSIAAGAHNGDDIMKLTRLPSEVFNQTITLLEIKGRIRALGMNNWALC